MESKKPNPQISEHVPEPGLDINRDYKEGNILLSVMHDKLSLWTLFSRYELGEYGSQKIVLSV